MRACTKENRMRVQMRKEAAFCSFFFQWRKQADQDGKVKTVHEISKKKTTQERIVSRKNRARDLHKIYSDYGGGSVFLP